MAAIIHDPTLLPFYLSLTEAAALAQVSTATVHDYCSRGVWQQGKQWSKPPRSRRRFLRDGIIAWLNPKVTIKPAKLNACRANIARSPELGALIEREAASGL